MKKNHRLKKRQTVPEPPQISSTEPVVQVDESAQPVYQLTQEELHTLQKLAAGYNSILDYVLARQKPWRFVWINLLLGMAKGFGVTLGITVLAFVGLKILSSLQILNLPVIGDFIAELLEYINNSGNLLP